ASTGIKVPAVIGVDEGAWILVFVAAHATVARNLSAGPRGISRESRACLFVDINDIKPRDDLGVEFLLGAPFLSRGSMSHHSPPLGARFKVAVEKIAPVHARPSPR